MSVDLQPEPVRTGPEFVQYEVADWVATIWLNRPEVKNCVNWARCSSSARRWSGPSATRTYGWC